MESQNDQRAAAPPAGRRSGRRPGRPPLGAPAGDDPFRDVSSVGGPGRTPMAAALDHNIARDRFIDAPAGSPHLEPWVRGPSRRQRPPSPRTNWSPLRSGPGRPLNLADPHGRVGLASNQSDLDRAASARRRPLVVVRDQQHDRAVLELHAGRDWPGQRRPAGVRCSIRRVPSDVRNIVLAYAAWPGWAGIQPTCTMSILEGRQPGRGRRGREVGDLLVSRSARHRAASHGRFHRRPPRRP